MKNVVESIFSVIATYFIYLVGGIDISLISLVLVMLIDYITGVMSAIYNKKLNSSVGFKGFLKKACYILIVILAVVLDRLLNNDGVMRTLVIYFFVANDGISILENIGQMDIPLPNKLKSVLEQLKEKGD